MYLTRPSTETLGRHVLVLLLLAGVAWFVLGMAFARNQIYQQGLVVLMWLPALAALVVFRAELRWLARARCGALTVLCLLLLWAMLSLTWSGVDEPLKHVKHILYMACLIVGVGVIGAYDERLLVRFLPWVAVVLGIAGFGYVYDFYIVDGNPWSARLRASGRHIGHPILGGYVFGICAAILLHELIRRAEQKVPAWLLLSALGGCILFMMMTQSRGVVLAFVASALLLALARLCRRSMWVVLLLAASAVAGYFIFEPFVTARGVSYRPEIFVQSVRLILENPFLGTGVLGGYEVVTAEGTRTFPHSHNAFLHVGIELGLFGFALYLALWVTMGWDAWKSRLTPFGALFLAVWAYATVATIVDIGSLWRTPRAQWMVTCFPVALWMALIASRYERGRADEAGVGRAV